MFIDNADAHLISPPPPPPAPDGLRAHGRPAGRTQQLISIDTSNQDKGVPATGWSRLVHPRDVWSTPLGTSHCARSWCSVSRPVGPAIGSVLAASTARDADLRMQLLPKQESQDKRQKAQSRRHTTHPGTVPPGATTQEIARRSPATALLLSSRSRRVLGGCLRGGGEREPAGLRRRGID